MQDVQRSERPISSDKTEPSNVREQMMESKTLELFSNAINDIVDHREFPYAHLRVRHFLSESAKYSFGNKKDQVYYRNDWDTTILAKNQSTKSEQSIDFMIGAFLHLTPLGVVYLMYLDVHNGVRIFTENQDNIYSHKVDEEPNHKRATLNTIALIMKVIYNLIIDVLLYPVLVISFCIRLFNQVYQLGFGKDKHGTLGNSSFNDDEESDRLDTDAETIEVPVPGIPAGYPYPSVELKEKDSFAEVGKPHNANGTYPSMSQSASIGSNHTNELEASTKDSHLFDEDEEKLSGIAVGGKSSDRRGTNNATTYTLRIFDTTNETNERDGVVDAKQVTKLDTTQSL